MTTHTVLLYVSRAYAFLVPPPLSCPPSALHHLRAARTRPPIASRRRPEQSAVPPFFDNGCKGETHSHDMRGLDDGRRSSKSSTSGGQRDEEAFSVLPVPGQ